MNATLRLVSRLRSKVIRCQYYVTETRTKIESEPTEIQVPVPWGHIAVKDWGPSPGSSGTTRVLLGLHGWQDNAATFDLLAPELPPGWRLLAMDFQGHGMSSHLAPGSTYTHEEFTLGVRRLVRHFGWDRFSMMGHSLGGAVAGLYASLYPKQVESVVMLDTVYPVQGSHPNWAKLAGHRMDQSLDIERKLAERAPPTYSFEDAVSRASERMAGQVSPEGVRVVMTRGLCEATKGRFYYSRDLRLQVMTVPTLSREQLKELYTNLKCRLLFVRASERVIPAAKYDDTDLYEVFKRTCPVYQMEQVEGQHFVHLDKPKVVGPIVSRFLQEVK